MPQENSHGVDKLDVDRISGVFNPEKHEPFFKELVLIPELYQEIAIEGPEIRGMWERARVIQRVLQVPLSLHSMTRLSGKDGKPLATIRECG